MTAFTSSLSSSLALNNSMPNGGSENSPAFTAATNTNNRFVDGTAAGSTTNDQFRWFFQKAGTSTAQFDSSTANSGGNSLKLSTTATASNAFTLSGSNTTAGNVAIYGIPVSPSTAYTLTFYMKTNFTSGDSSDGAFIQVLDYNSAGTNTASHVSTKIKTTTGFTKYTINFTTGSTVVAVFISPRITGNTGTATLIMDAWFDDIVLTQDSMLQLIRKTSRTLLPSLSFAGGFFRNSNVPFLGGGSFTGASTKRTTRLLGSSMNANNIIPNADFENAPPFVSPTTINQRWVDGTAGGSTSNDQYGWAMFSQAGSVALQFDSSISHSGASSLKVSTTATGSVCQAAQYPVDGATQIVQYGIPILPNTSYTFRFWLKTLANSGAATTGAQVRLLERTAANTDLHETAIAGVAITQDWTQYIATFTTNASAAYLQVMLQVKGNDGTGTLVMDAWFDDISLAQTSSGVLTKLAKLPIAAAASFSGSISRRISYILAGALNLTGVTSAFDMHFASFTASVTSAGSLTKRGLKRFAAAFSITAYPFGSGTFGNSGGTFGSGAIDALVKQVNRALSGGGSFAGNIPSRVIGAVLTGGASFSGNANRVLTRTLAAASVGFTGAWSFGRRYFRSFTAGVGYVGSAAKKPLHALSAAVNLIGIQVYAVGYVFSAELSFAGSLTRTVARALTAAAISFAGNVSKSTRAVFTAAISFTVVAAKGIVRGLAAAILFAGAMRGSALANFTGGLNFSVIFTRQIATSLAADISAHVPFIGALGRTTTRPLMATTSFVGAIARIPMHFMSGAISFTAGLLRAFPRSFTAAVGFFGKFLRRYIPKPVRGKPIILRSNDPSEHLRSDDTDITLK